MAWRVCSEEGTIRFRELVPVDKIITNRGRVKIATQLVRDAGIQAPGSEHAVERPFLSSSMGRAVKEIYEIDPLRDQRWLELVDRHPLASVFHSANWLKALKGVYGYEPVALTSCPPGIPLSNGIVFCRIKSWLTGRRLVSLPFADHCEPLVGSPEELDALLTHTKLQVDREKLKYAEIRPVSCQPGGVAAFNPLATYVLQSLDLRPAAEELFRKFHKDCVQRKIRRAERERLQYEQGASEDLLQKFYRLLVMTRRRHFLPPQPLSWFRGLIAAFGEDLEIRVASKDGVPVASILTLAHKKTMVYKYGCSNVALNNLGGTALLFWNAIQEAKDAGFVEFEMGRSDMDNLGLIAFKERWGASRQSLSYWRYPNVDSPETTLWSNLARPLVSLAPDLVLETAGALLYKHIG